MRVFHTILLIASFICSAANASVDITAMDFKSGKNDGSLTIKFDGKLKQYPELRVTESVIQVVIPNSKVNREMNRKVSFSTTGKDTTLNLGKYANNSSRLKAIFPFSLEKMRDKVSLMIKDNKIELNFPRVAVKAKPVAAKKPAAKKTVAKKKNADYLNEDYLNSLIDLDENKVEKVVAGKVIKPKMNKDVVKTTQAGLVKTPTDNSKSSFSLVEYGGKFVAFLGVTLLLFYGVISLMKKGFIKKGKLGFLNKTNQIEVLSQTHLAPKKSLMMIRAHNQVFLVSNTDSGIHPISEIRDVAGLLKDGEKKIAGNNFDDSLLSSNNDETIETKVKIKEDITKSNKESSLSDYLEVKDKVKFSDQIKKKVKNLKPLQ